MIERFDLVVFNWLNSWAFQHPAIDAAVIFSAVFLGYWLILGVAAFVLVTLPPLSVVFPSFRKLRGKHIEMVFIALIAAIVARFGIAEIIRLVYDRTRPFEALSEVHQLIFRDSAGSFPSGHATFFFTLAFVVGKYYPKASVFFYAGATIMSFGRVMSGVHWPSDILGGAIIGFLVGFLVNSLITNIRAIRQEN